MGGGLVRKWEAWTLLAATGALVALITFAAPSLVDPEETLPRCSDGSYLQGTCAPDETGSK